ncbi:MAG: glycerol-3-phosphate acyltransferase [Armatimonadetes bacterium]|nr:glycerol-3-phosphate acyltransferase [Armatimonadota bacterium]
MIVPIFCFLAYLIGAIPFGVLIGKWTRGIDIREHGSGNIGAANAFRILGPGPAILVLLADGMKGIAPVVLFRTFCKNPGLVFLCLSWKATLAGFGVWALVTGVSRVTALGSISAALILPVSAWFFQAPPETVVFAVAACGLAVYKHRPNIKRLLEGKELKV